MSMLLEETWRRLREKEEKVNRLRKEQENDRIEYVNILRKMWTEGTIPLGKYIFSVENDEKFHKVVFRTTVSPPDEICNYTTNGSRTIYHGDMTFNYRIENHYAEGPYATLEIHVPYKNVTTFLRDYDVRVSKYRVLAIMEETMLKEKAVLNEYYSALNELKGTSENEPV